LLASTCLGPPAARAWTFREHEEVGSLGYAEACRRLEQRYAMDGAPAAVRGRLAVACRDVDVNALLYGKANGTAGDRITDPEEFLSSIGAFRATSRVHYLRLKMVNSTHFHPKSAREWRTYHRQALRRAVQASAMSGLDQIDALELAVYENAFADHFLQDSFCAGHMGFNRPASSAAATLVFHDAWNAKGRIVRNRDGISWRTYGDEGLNRPENAEGRRQVIAATSKSVYDVLLTFIEGKRSPEEELAIWRSLPFTIEAPSMRAPVEALLAVLAERAEPTGLDPLAAINLPARKDTSLEGWTMAAGPFARHRPLLGVLGGLTLSVPFLSPMIYGGLGGSRGPDEERTRLIGELGLLRPLGLTNDGVISHEVLAGVVWRARLDELTGMVQASYRINAELGRTLVRLQVGPAYRLGEGEIGYYVSVGIGYLLSARGGGSI
jgi:hypothetical protein